MRLEQERIVEIVENMLNFSEPFEELINHESFSFFVFARFVWSCDS